MKEVTNAKKNISQIDVFVFLPFGKELQYCKWKNEQDIPCYCNCPK